MVSAPFHVEVVYPTNDLRMGEVLPLHVRICNRYSQTTERLSLKVELHELFLVTGSNSAVFEISPNQEHVVSLGLVPLDAGYIPLPHISIHWLSMLGVHSEEGRARDRTSSVNSVTTTTNNSSGGSHSGASSGTARAGSGSGSVSVASTGKVLLDLSNQSSPRYVFVRPGACAAEAASRANAEAKATVRTEVSSMDL